MREKLLKLEEFDTPSIANVVATYPLKDFCLGLYHPWEGRWYTDQRLRCMFPELGRRAGYAATCVYGLHDPQFTRLGIGDVLEALAAAPKPAILAIRQNLPEPLKSRSGLIGGNMMTAFKSAGVIGVLSDGPSRDVDEIRPLGLQYMITGVTPGHGDFGVQAVNVPVDICGMEVAPGEIVHMDENGAVKFPADRLDDVLARAGRLRLIEQKRQKMMRETGDAGELAKIMRGIYD
ncbi:MAG: RraA family protein [Planctomycetota bacterium]|jgi:regulator of RNase E activity RraA|nr:RraA family protein [Planctomycetota bacterium]